MKYIVHYTEMIGRSFIVDADGSSDAMDKVKDLAETGCFELTLDDYLDDSSDVNYDDYWDGAEDFYPNIDEFAD